MKLVTEPACIFCKIVAGTIPSFKVYENDHVLAFLDVNPLSEGHTLVIPKYHAQKVHQIPEDEMAHVGRAISIVSKAVGAEDYNILQNNGAAAHQAVFHVHFHIIPRSGDHGLGINWNSQPADKAKLGELAQQIKSRI